MANFDNGLAPVVNVAKEEAANVPRSKFNMSCVKYTNGIIGALEPIDLLETLPNEDYEIGYDVLAQLRNPTVRQALNGMSIFVHTYWCPKKDLWRGFKNYITGGRSGNVTLEVPKLCPIIASNSAGGAINKTTITPSGTDVNTFVPFAPSSFMGLPIARCAVPTEISGTLRHANKNKWYEAVGGSGTNPHVKRINQMQGCFAVGESAETVDTDMFWGVSALPFVMYNKIYRDYYANENMLSKNKNWYHDDSDEDLILPYTLPAGNLTGYTNCTDGDIYNLSSSDKERAHVPMYNETETNGDKPILNMLHFRQFRGDYFTTANIFKDLLRGDAPTLDIGDINFDPIIDDIGAGIGVQGAPAVGIALQYASEAMGGKRFGIWDLSQSNATPVTNSSTIDLVKSVLKSTMERIKIPSLSLNAFRKAVVMEKLMMRNATTNGSYRELIGIQFGYYPSDYERKPTLVGGTKFDVMFNTVTATNFDANANNLGQKTSDGYASGSGYIGKFHSDDHGYLMTILSIVPDVYYANQGLDSMFTRTTKDKEYTPLLNNLEPMAIKNKEIFISKKTDYNENAWGYADNFEDWKSRRNKVSGLAVCGELYDRAQFMFREFTNSARPALNEKFLAMTPDNIDMSMFTSVNEPPFDLTIGCNITKVSPMPYVAHPADMGIKY